MKMLAITEEIGEPIVAPEVCSLVVIGEVNIIVKQCCISGMTRKYREAIEI